jgi:rhodanese-related sulfurtransferase
MNAFFGTSTKARLQTAAPSEAIGFFNDPNTVFVDVRGHGEIAATGTIKGAIRAPLPEFASHAQPGGGGSLPPVDAGKRIVLICASGMRSQTAGRQLIGLGYAEVVNVSGGFGRWAAAGGPVER